MPDPRKRAKKKVAARKAGAAKAARRPARKVARKKAARRFAKKTVRKKAARRLAKKTVRRKAAGRPAKRAPARPLKRSARERARNVGKKAGQKVAKGRVGKPALGIVKARPAPAPAAERRAPAATAFAGAKGGATAKELMLFELERARVSVHAALQGLGEAAANEPVAPGKWSARQVVLHLAQWDREIEGWIEPVYSRGRPMPFEWSKIHEHNARRLAEVDHMGWEDAKRFLQSARAELLATLESIPDEPAEVWTAGHALGQLIAVLPEHDRHHADQIKNARSAARES